jgi:uncharacterized protein (TIGR03643 family)
MAFQDATMDTNDERCCGTGTCIINDEGLCWCGQQWNGTMMCRPEALPMSMPLHLTLAAALQPTGRAHGHMTRAQLALTESDISRVVEMAWEDRTAFEAIEAQFGLNESAVVDVMRRHMKPSSFRMWRKRMAGRATKHLALRSPAVQRHRARHTRQA